MKRIKSSLLVLIPMLGMGAGGQVLADDVSTILESGRPVEVTVSESRTVKPCSCGWTINDYVRMCGRLSVQSGTVRDNA